MVDLNTGVIDHLVRLSRSSFHVAWTTATHCCMASSPVGTERCRPPGHRRPSSWPHHISVTAAPLAASPSASRVQDLGACTSVAPMHLADDCRQGHTHFFSSSGIWWWALANRSCLLNLKSVASSITEIYGNLFLNSLFEPPFGVLGVTYELHL